MKREVNDSWMLLQLKRGIELTGKLQTAHAT